MGEGRLEKVSRGAGGGGGEKQDMVFFFFLIYLKINCVKEPRLLVHGFHPSITASLHG